MLKTINEHIIINSYQLIGTAYTIYEAFEPSSFTGNHSSLQVFHNQVYGNVSSRRMGNRADNTNEAIQHILDAFPHLETTLQCDMARIDPTMGRIEVWAN